MTKSKLAIIILLLLAIGCVPVDVIDPITTTPSPSPILNTNPELELGGCHNRTFRTDKWGTETIKQCVPSGYTLFEILLNESPPMRSVYTGAAYSVLPHGSIGAIGYSQPIALNTGLHIVKVDGDLHMWGGIGDTWIGVNADGVEVGKYPIEANGEYMAMFSFTTQTQRTYDVDVYLWVQHATTTADSYLTFGSITVEAVAISP